MDQVALVEKILPPYTSDAAPLGIAKTEISYKSVHSFDRTDAMLRTSLRRLLGVLDRQPKICLAPTCISAGCIDRKHCIARIRRVTST